MIAFLNILFKTKDTFDYLDEQYEDKLNTNCNLIFMVLGAFSGFEAFYRDLDYIKDSIANNGGTIIWWILTTIVGAGLGLLFGRYFLTYILYGLGKLLKGAGKVIDIKVIAAYSLIPNLLIQPVIIFLESTHKFNAIVGLEYWIINSLNFLIWIWTLKILFQGISRFNKFGFGKTLLNISPVLLIGVAPYALYYIFR